MLRLSKDEWRRRVNAAVALRGIDLQDLPDADGLPKQAAKRAGHLSDDYMPNEALATATARQLDLPEEWFTAPDFDAWLGEPRGSTGPDVAELLEVVSALDAKIDRVLGQVAALAGEVGKVQAALPAQRGTRPQDRRRLGDSGS